MKQNFSIKFIKLLLILTMLFCVVMLFFYSTAGLFAPEELYGNIIDILVAIIIVAIYIIIACNLLKIVFSMDSTPFSLKNVKSFKIIGYLMVLLSLIDALDSIINFKKLDDIVALGIMLEDGIIGIRPTCILYLVLGIMALVLAEIFKKAVKIKNENDLTI
ncbi:DUF2975 domain-containing protein [Clostridium tepidum]|jgi:hypothetical protein|uniref:DUF2975 domain-containing protein n=1 Tax=Clostridium tepidum TaxID=1962263 RepID=A0A1S9I6M9_9CLOT|nr:DUF2975 domain-containing protein [Clostridium tepidum]MCR1934663.1 DUF2975 domain-containing protein [Clostridium tepidum]MDU6877696.1 DUF2975 domain-containing protein [Clostridium botulinum]OOO62461.1 hypothetical protein BS637_06380 [Clostridium tepidum]OOO65943.1 hypothetical protein BS638_07785 [Clostridium tepidum]